MPDGTRVRHQVSEGDRVLFGSYAGAEVEVNGEELLIMNEERNPGRRAREHPERGRPARQRCAIRSLQ